MTDEMPKVKAPFPYYGGKRKVADMVWERLGEVAHYIEPFAGSLAVLLARPHKPRIETVNDTDCFLTNFWRCVRDLPASHRWLVGVTKPEPKPADWAHSDEAWLAACEVFRGTPNASARTFREHLRNDPDYRDPLYAARWVWGICQWIGGGWCQTRDGEYTDDATHDRRPLIGGFEAQTGLPANWERLPNMDKGQPAGGRGVHGAGDIDPLNSCSEAMPVFDQCRTTGRGVHGVGEQDHALTEGRPQLADAFDVGRGVHSHKAAGTMESRLRFLERWFLALADRLRLVRVCCGDWKRVCNSESVTTRLGICGIFLDPPYGVKAERDNRLYGTDSLTVADDVRAWCIENQANPKMRICLAGYEDEHLELSEKHGWTMVAWESKGYGSRTEKGKENQKKERLWFSPHCLVPDSKPTQSELFE